MKRITAKILGMTIWNKVFILRRENYGLALDHGFWSFSCKLFTIKKEVRSFIILVVDRITLIFKLIQETKKE